MLELCVRLEMGGPRLFPPIRAGFLEASGAGSDRGSPGLTVAGRLVALADRPMSRRQRVLGWGLDLPGQFGRALWLFREGVRSESDGRWGRADFYWREFADAFRALTGRPGDME